MKNKLTLHYVIAFAAMLIVIYALFLLFQDPERTRSLLLTIIGCAVVGVGQILIIRSKRKSGNK